MILKFFIISALFICSYGLPPETLEPVIVAKNAYLLGNNECTWGPSYWCKSLQSAHSCKAVKHCIKKVWETQTVPEDNDDICTICKNMVKEARDQLESNETMDELRQVFEGSCKLIYIKPVVKECQRLADELVPELVETLSSQMNPDIVCSVAGLCNNATIDKMIEEYKKTQPSNEPTTQRIEQCQTCNKIVDRMSAKFNSVTKEDVLHRMLQVCGQLGSYSDACSTIILDYFESIYGHIERNLNSRAVCHLTGSCSFVYHRHGPAKEPGASDIGVVSVANDASTVTVRRRDGDEECDMCVQLIGYLRSILVANTTESEFQLVLRGLCKQTGKFAPQCLSIVEEYYRQIYGYLVDDLNGKTVCSFMSLCPRPGYDRAPIWPLLPEAPRKAISYGDVPVDVAAMQLPIERMHVVAAGPTVAVDNKNACVFCEYFLHYIQQFISQPVEEENLKRLVFEACEKLPQSVRYQCKEFVDLYGNVVVAILVEEIDPSQVCPSIGVCPAKQSSEHHEVIPLGVSKPACPLCLLAIEELDKKLENNRTEESVRQALDNLCSTLPKSLVQECDDLVRQYTEELIDMLVADFTPQEVCIYLKLCPVSVVRADEEHAGKVQELMTNEIPDVVPAPAAPSSDTDKTLITAEMINKKDSTVCVVCEFVMSKLSDSLKENATDEEIKEAVHAICNRLPGTVSRECNKFVDEYGDVVISVLTQSVEPQAVCAELKLCRDDNNNKANMAGLQRVVEECAVCEATVGALNSLLQDRDVDSDITEMAARVCPMLKSKSYKCRQLIEVYGRQIIMLLVDIGVRPGVVCYKLHMCDQSGAAKLQTSDVESRLPRGHLIGGNRCTWGPSYWCQSEDHANSCGTIQHCRERVWKSDKPVSKV